MPYKKNIKKTTKKRKTSYKKKAYKSFKTKKVGSVFTTKNIVPK